MAHRLVCYQCPRNGGIGMPDLGSHWLTERLAYLGRSLSRDMVWRQKVRDVFPCLKSNPKAKGHHRARDEALFICECCMAVRNLSGSSDLSRPQKELYRELVGGDKRAHTFLSCSVVLII